jgi:hypothetical protein
LELNNTNIKPGNAHKIIKKNQIMKIKTYSIFGAGAAGLYTAWRLLNGEAKKPNDPLFQKMQLQKNDILELYDWGQYNFSEDEKGSREAGARICTWHYQNNTENSYVELGGMRYVGWDKTIPDTKTATTPGHRLVTETIEKLGLHQYAVPFNVTSNQLFYLRNRNFYINDISSNQPAPYDVDHFGASAQPDNGFTTVQDLAMTPEKAGKMTRTDWNNFYHNGAITVDMPDSSVFQKGDKLKDIGYWNLLYDQLGSEGYNYAADGNGYSSNVINSNSAVDINSNNEFAPGSQYMTLTKGYSYLFKELFKQIVALCKKKGIHFKYHPNTRLHSILNKNGLVHFTTAGKKNPWKKSGEGIADAAWMAMGRYAIEQVANATQYIKPDGLDVLNHKNVILKIESAIMQPSYKVGMFFKEAWWSTAATTPAPYPAFITGYVVTKEVVETLRKNNFPKEYTDALPAIFGIAYVSSQDLVAAAEGLNKISARLTIKQTNELIAAARRDSIGPSVADSPIRMVVYFGNNALNQEKKPVYGILASYDDEDNTTFWQELELGTATERTVPVSEDIQPLIGPKKVPKKMVKMLRKMLAELHFGPNSNYTNVPEPIEAAYVDWSLPPFNAGYHQWAAHFDIGEVQRNIRKPSQLIPGADANIFIVGEAYSNDQAWVEGAFCTSESVLNDFFGVKPFIDPHYYPFICSKTPKKD